MQLHRLGIDVRLKRTVVVRKWWKLECHKTSLLTFMYHTREDSSLNIPAVPPLRPIRYRAAYHCVFTAHGLVVCDKWDRCQAEAQLKVALTSSATLQPRSPKTINECPII